MPQSSDADGELPSMSSLMTSPGNISRRKMLLGIWVASGAMTMAGCAQTGDENGPDVQPPASPYAGEPFPVRLVNRKRFDPSFRPATVPNATGEAPGTIVIDTDSRHLYLVKTPETALRFGIAVGAAGNSWKGTAFVGRKSKWPAWHPTDEMKQVAPGIPSRIPPGDDNPLGARALYLDDKNGKDTLYRIHGTSEPWTIGTRASSGCIRMFNEDVIALYDQVPVGTRVIVR